MCSDAVAHAIGAAGEQHAVGIYCFDGVRDSDAVAFVNTILHEALLGCLDSHHIFARRTWLGAHACCQFRVVGDYKSSR